MNEITIDGVEYLKASIIAKQYKYTADYVGQLCRGRKVDAKLVGRTWYVNPLSLTSHKTARYVKESVGDKTIEDKVEIEVSRLDVEPVPRKTAIKVSNNSVVAPANFLKRVEWQPLKYEADEAELNPSFQHLDNPVKVDVELADSKNLKINSTHSKTILQADPLPSVPLRGTLNLSSLDVDFDYIEENIASTETIVVESKPDTRKGTKVFLNKITTPDFDEKPRNNETKEISESEATYEVEIKGVRGEAPLSFTPARVKEPAFIIFDPARVKERTFIPVEPEATASQSLSFWWVVVVSVVGLGILIILYFVEFSIVASVQNFTPSWQINFSTDWPL